MGFLVCNGAMCSCSFGAAPATVVVLPNKVMAGSMPAATIMENKPMLNISTFGMCSSPANPTVASATAAALGVLTPMPCVPMLTAPWAPGSPTVLVGGKPALNNSCKLTCAYGGVISISNPGQQKVQVK